MISDLWPSSDNKAKISCRSDGSAANPVPQMKHPVAPDRHVGVLQQVLSVDRPEVRLARTKYDRHDIHCHLIHEPQAKARPPAATAPTATVRSPARSLAFPI